MPGLMDILHGAAQVPGAIGGGALDILIGDRTNVTPGEQAKRAIQALLLGGEHGENLIGLQQMNARSDALNQQAVGTPQFQDAVAQLMQRGVPGEQAYDHVAQLYGVSGYRPDFSPPTAIQAPADPSGLPSPSIQQSRIPLLPPPAPEKQVKYAAAQEQLRGISRPGAEGAYSLAQLAKINPDLAVQDQLMQDALRKYQKPGLNQTTITFNDGKIAGTVQPLGRNDTFFPLTDEGRERAIVAADAFNQMHKQLGSAERMAPVLDPRGGWGLRVSTSERDQALQAGAVSDYLDTRDPRYLATPTTPGSAAPTTATTTAGPPLASPAAPPAPGAPPSSAPLQGRTARKTADEQRKVDAKGAAEAESNVTRVNAAMDMIDALGPAANLRPEQFDSGWRGYVENSLYGLYQHFRASRPNVQGNAALSTYDGAIEAMTVPLFRMLGDKNFRNFEAIRKSAEGVIPTAADTEPIRQVKVSAMRNLFLSMNQVPKGDDNAANATIKQVLGGYAQQLAALDRGEVPQSAPVPNAQPTPAAMPPGIDPDLAAVIARRRGGPQ